MNEASTAQHTRAEPSEAKLTQPTNQPYHQLPNQSINQPGLMSITWLFISLRRSQKEPWIWAPQADENEPGGHEQGQGVRGEGRSASINGTSMVHPPVRRVQCNQTPMGHALP